MRALPSEGYCQDTVLTSAVILGGMGAAGVRVVTRGIETEDEMKVHHSGQTITELITAATMQTEAIQQRVVFAWGQALFTELYQVWTQLETEEAMAYEDKVTAQVHVLEDATASLEQLYSTMHRTSHRLKRHLQSMRP